MKGILLFLFLGTFAFAGLQAQSVLGKWQTTSSETGKPSAIIEVYSRDGEVRGKIIQVLDEKDRNKKCVKCKGDLKDEPVKGMVILKGLEKDGIEFKGGTITDPVDGKEYRCKMWLDKKDPNRLNVRGYVGFLYETRIWNRVK